MTGWSARRPPAADRELARWTVDEPTQLRSLRAGLHRVAEQAVPAGADHEDLADRLTIVATELAGNALRHGRPPAVVVLLRAAGALILDVLDGDAASAPEAGGLRPDGDGGLGLVLAGRLAEDVGWYPRETGKGVWAVFRT